MTDEKLIEEAAKALHEATYGDGSWEHREQIEDDLYRRRARAVLAVFEKAHTPSTPTDDEREALARLIQAAKGMRSWFTETADNVLGRIKTDTHEDVMLYHDAVSILVTARQMIDLLADSEKAEPQGEPSDAQVLAAAQGATNHEIRRRR